MNRLVGLFNLINSDIKASGVGYKRFFFNENVRAVISYRFNSFIYKNFSRDLAYILHNRDKMKYGVDIYPASVIGNLVTIQSCLTSGQKDSKSGFPIVGDNVYIGTGAKVVGSVKIGDGVTIGANSVVLKDAESFSILVGAPARPIK